MQHLTTISTRALMLFALTGAGAIGVSAVRGSAAEAAAAATVTAGATTAATTATATAITQPAPDAATRSVFRPGALVADVRSLDDPVAVAIAPDGSILVAEGVGARVSIFEPPRDAWIDAAAGLDAGTVAGANAGDGDEAGAGAGAGATGAGTGAEAANPMRGLRPATGVPRLALRRTIDGTGPDGAGAPMQRPSGLAVDDAGRVYVSDGAARHIRVFEADGTPAGILGATPPGAAPILVKPAGLAVHDDIVAVADAATRRVERFRRDGTRLDPLIADPPMLRPSGLAFSADGRLAVCDGDGSRVVLFAADGSFERSFGVYGPFPGLLDEPTDVVWRDDRLFVVDRRNHRVQIHDLEGGLVEPWGVHAIRPHDVGGTLHYPDGFAIDGAGRFAVVSEGFEDRIQVYARTDVVFDPETYVAPPPIRETHVGRRVDLSGPLLVLAEPEAHRVHLFETSRSIPIVIGGFGERGRGNGLLLRTGGLAFDAESGRLLLVDEAKRRLQEIAVRYDPEEPRGFRPGRFRFTRFFDLERLLSAAEPPLAQPPSINAVVDLPDGGAALLDIANDRIHVLDERLRLVRSLGGRGTLPGRFRRPTDLAVAADGTSAWVVDADNQRVQLIDLADGAALGSFGRRGDGPGAFLDPYGVAVLPDGRIAVSDRGSHDVEIFTARGESQVRFGGQGPAHRDLWKPAGLGIHPDGGIVVMDDGNHRAKIFGPDGGWRLTFGTGRAWTSRETDAGAIP